jgi:hypothetical protein
MEGDEEGESNMVRYEPPETKRLQYVGPFVPLFLPLTSNGSLDPAHTTSPLGSTARLRNCVGVGVVRVLKFRYLNKSCARTVPSNDAERIACPEPKNASALIGASCAVNVA